MLRQRSRLQTSSLSLFQERPLSISDKNWEWFPPQRTKHENIIRHSLCHWCQRGRWKLKEHDDRGSWKSIMIGGETWWQEELKEHHDRGRSMMTGGARKSMSISIDDKEGDYWKKGWSCHWCQSLMTMVKRQSSPKMSPAPRWVQQSQSQGRRRYNNMGQPGITTNNLEK